MVSSPRQDWCEKLCYRDGKKWLPLPGWARSLIKIGWAIGSRPKVNERVLTVLLLPHRGFASTFVSLGYVLSQAIPSPSEPDLDRHFAKLLALPDHHEFKTSLIYLFNGMTMHGVFDGVHLDKGIPFVRVRVQASSPGSTGGATHMVGRNRASDLHVDPHGGGRLGNRIHARATVRNAAFSSGLYTRAESNRIHISSTAAVTVFGRLNWIHSEICEEQFGCKTEAGIVYEGLLNEILKVDRFVSNSTRPRVRLVPTSTQDGVLTDEVRNSGLAIFDGSDSYLKWAHQFDKSDLVAVLCQTDNQIAGAIENINARALTASEVKDDELMSTLMMPDIGADGTVLWEGRG
jgi:hypothetical protein